MRCLSIFVFILALPVAGLSATIKIPSDFPAIQDGINAATNNDTVLVSPGFYTENIDFLGKAITVKSSDGPEKTTINGGIPGSSVFGSTVTFKNKEGLDSVFQGFTLIKGIGTLVNKVHYGGNIYCLNSSPTIKNNIISHSTFKTDTLGGGVACLHGASPLIINNTIKSNYGFNGAGIYCFDNSSPHIINNEIIENKGDIFLGTAGGIYGDSGCNLTIRNNIISKNQTCTGGAIVVGNNCQILIEGNLIHDNEAFGESCGIVCYSQARGRIANNRITDNDGNSGACISGGLTCLNDCDLEIINNFFTGNKVSSFAAGIFCSASKLILINNTIRGNSQGSMYEPGAGIYCEEGSTLDVFNTIIWENFSFSQSQIYIGSTANPSTMNISYSNVQKGNVWPNIKCDPGCVLNWGSGMIKLNPKFIGAYSVDSHLTFNSPCKDTGLNSAVLDPYDFEGDPRIVDGTVDMGADEFHTHFYVTGDASPGGTIDLKFVDAPNTAPVVLWLGSGVLSAPIKLPPYGEWHLQFPVLLEAQLGAIPGPSGVLSFPCSIPPNLLTPMDLPLQAGIGSKLTNHLVLEIK